MLPVLIPVFVFYRLRSCTECLFGVIRRQCIIAIMIRAFPGDQLSCRRALLIGGAICMSGAHGDSYERPHKRTIRRWELGYSDDPTDWRSTDQLVEHYFGNTTRKAALPRSLNCSPKRAQSPFAQGQTACDAESHHQARALCVDCGRPVFLAVPGTRFNLQQHRVFVAQERQAKRAEMV